MELRDLEYFLACVDQGSVTAAAHRTHAAQPTVSHALARLEREVGQSLIERRPRSALKLTAAGELLAARARLALGALRAFEFDLAALRGRIHGPLRIASIQSLNATLLPDVLVQFLQKYPEVQIAARTYPGEDIARRIAGGLEDVGIIAGPVASRRVPVTAGLSEQLLYCERFAAVVPLGHPLARSKSVALSRLAGERLVLVPESSLTGTAISDAFERANVVPNIVMTIASTEALCEAVKRGVGITLLPRSYQVRASYRLKSVPLRDSALTREVKLLMLGDEFTSPAARAFRSLLVDVTRTARDGGAVRDP